MPEIILQKFYENRMLGSAKTNVPLLTLTSWVKGTSSFVSKNVFKSEIIFSPIFPKRIPSWLSSSLNPLKSFRLDFIIVSKDLRKERGSDPELLFTSFRLDLSNFFLNFFYRTLRSYTLSPLISFRLDDPWQSVLPPPSPLEMRSPEEMIKIKNMNQMTFAKIKK